MPWKDIVRTDKYKSLSSEQQEVLKKDYFDKIAVPKIKEAGYNVEKVKQQFFKKDFTIQESIEIRNKEYNNMENLGYAVSSFGLVFLSIILFSSLLTFYRKKFKGFKDQENLKYTKISKLPIYFSIVISLIATIIGACVIISELSSYSIDEGAIVGMLLIIIYALINLSALLNVRSDSLIFMFLEKRRLDAEISVIKKRKELANLKLEEK